MPANDLDMQMLITDPAWQNLSPQLREQLIKLISTTVDEQGNIKEEYSELHGILGVYTRDIRLGNLSSFNGEFEFVSYYLELAVDLLEDGQPSACVVALNKGLSILELSSSKGGFLRKLLNTLVTESYTNSLEPEKKNPLGNAKSGGK